MATHIFNPGGYVPLSPYAIAEPGQSQLRLPVHVDIAAYVAGRGGRLLAARLHDGELSYDTEAQYDSGSSELVVNARPGEIIVAISKLLRNTFPIATHWDAGADGGRGGARHNATDGLGTIRLDSASGELVAELGPFTDQDPDSPYLYATDRLGLFADRTARTASYGRYIGDVYSLYAVTDEAALRLSADVLADTGYPVLFRNAAHPGDSTAEAANAANIDSVVVEASIASTTGLADTSGAEVCGLPLFQAINNHVVLAEAGAGAGGSLATVLLPPGWALDGKDVRNGQEKHGDEGRGGGYPCLFSGFYDQNDNMYRNCGIYLLRAIAEAHRRTGKWAIGVVWNGGGSSGTRTQQPSAFGMMNSLFGLLKSQYGIDPYAIVTVGGSRGGLTALLAASNPVADGYAVRYAVCYGVPFSIYEPAERLLNSTLPALWEGVCSDLGYKNAWQEGWRDEEGNTAIQRYRLNTFGTADEERIARELSLQSERMLEALRKQGTRVWLNTSTHDPFTPLAPALEWLGRARAAGIIVRHEIGYRHGHNNCTDPYAAAASCLASLCGGPEPIAAGTTSHYRRTSEELSGWRQTEPFEPERMPALFEGPRLAIAGRPAMLFVYGPPGVRYRLVLRPAAEEALQAKATGQTEATRWAEATPEGEDERLVLMEGVLPAAEGTPLSYAAKQWAVPDAWGGRCFSYTFVLEEGHAVENGEPSYLMRGEWIYPAYTPHPGGSVLPAKLEVLAAEPDYTGAAWISTTMVDYIGWGLSEV